MSGPGKDPAHPAQQRRIKAPEETFASRLVAFLKSRVFHAYAESVAITLALPLLGRYLKPADPFFVQSGFSWMAVPPVLVALRHGFGPGVSSALLLVALIVARAGGRRASLVALPSELLYGVTFLTMVVGQVSAATARRFAKVELDGGHARRQLDAFARTYMLLELSHERLEQRAPTGLSPLRAALGMLTRLHPEAARDTPELAAVAGKMLEIMAMYGRVQAASVLAVDARLAAAPEAVATLGAVAPVEVGDALLVAALASGDITYATPRADAEGQTAPTKLLAVVPLTDARGRRIAAVAIEAMPFVALEHSNLRLLAVIAAWVADVVSPAAAASEVADARLAHFETRLERAAADARLRSVPSAVMAFSSAKGSRGTEVLEALIATDLRNTDMPLLRHAASGDPVLVILMTLTDQQGTLAFRSRLDRLSRERFGADLAKLGVDVHAWALDATTDLGAVRAELARRVDVGGETRHVLEAGSA